MADSIVRDFLIDCKTVTDAEVHSFASTLRENNELIEAIILVLEEKDYHREFLEPVCEQLFLFFQAEEETLRQFSHFFLPCLVGVYFSLLHRRDRKALRCVEIVLLGAYNLHILDQEGHPTVTTYNIPSISKPSIYHEPTMLPQPQLTENLLSKLEHGDNKVLLGPYQALESLSASNRLQVAVVVLRTYNQSISIMPQASRASLCRMCSRVVNQGCSLGGGLRMSCEGSLPPAFLPRVFLSSQLLLEMLQAIYFSMFNGLFSLGHQALNDIHRRAMQSMFTDVLLVTNAIKNSLEGGQCGHPGEGPMGISVAISPTTSTTTVSKAIITNASFRTKKLPDDIPIPREGESMAGVEGSLEVIKEEGAEEAGMAGQAIAGAKAMIQGLPKLPAGMTAGMTKLVKGMGRRESLTEKQPVAADARSVVSTMDSPRLNESTMAAQFVDLQASKRDTVRPLDSGLEQSEMRKTSGTKSKDTTTTSADKKESSSAPRSLNLSRGSGRDSGEARKAPEKKEETATAESSRKESSRKGSSRKEESVPVEQRKSSSRKEESSSSRKEEVATAESRKSSRKEESPTVRNGLDKADSASTTLHDTVGSTELRNLATAEQTSFRSNEINSLKNGDKPRSTQV